MCIAFTNRDLFASTRIDNNIQYDANYAVSEVISTHGSVRIQLQNENLESAKFIRDIGKGSHP